jgi:hypothetical protein
LTGVSTFAVVDPQVPHPEELHGAHAPVVLLRTVKGLLIVWLLSTVGTGQQLQALSQNEGHLCNRKSFMYLWFDPFGNELDNARSTILGLPRNIGAFRPAIQGEEFGDTYAQCQVALLEWVSFE